MPTGTGRGGLATSRIGTFLYTKNICLSFGRSRVIQKSLCPEWNECFFLTANDGLHTAKFIKLVVTDDSRSGRDHLMGAGERIIKFLI